MFQASLWFSWSGGVKYFLEHYLAKINVIGKTHKNQQSTGTTNCRLGFFAPFLSFLSQQWTNFSLLNLMINKRMDILSLFGSLDHSKLHNSGKRVIGQLFALEFGVFPNCFYFAGNLRSQKIFQSSIKLQMML